MCDLLENTVVSGSKDASVSLLEIDQDSQLHILTSFRSPDPVWSVRLSPDKSSIAVGTACISGGMMGRIPLFIQDTNCGRFKTLISDDNARKGAGITDIAFQNCRTILTTGYDGSVRLFDLNTGKCEWSWEEPFDSALFCLTCDDSFGLLVRNWSNMVGTARNCLIWTVDRRFSRAFKGIYIVKQRRSPVYSVVRKADCIFGATDSTVHRIELL